MEEKKITENKTNKVTREIKIKPVREAEYQTFNEWNRMILEEFLKQAHFSEATRKQYRSAGRIFLRWIEENVPNEKKREIYHLKTRHAARYQGWLDSLGLSPAIIRMRRSTVSSLCDYIDIYYGEDLRDDDIMFKNIFTKGIKQVPLSNVKEKVPLTLEELDHLLKELQKREEWQLYAYVILSYETSARRTEVSQFTKDIADAPVVYDVDTGESQNYYLTNTVRAKGKGRLGVVRDFQFGEDAMQAVKKWLEVRGEDDVPELFVRKLKSGETHALQPSAFNSWCSGILSDIVGRTINPHLFRRSRATHLKVHEGVDIKEIQNLLGHQSSETTEIYITDPKANSVSSIFRKRTVNTTPKIEEHKATEEPIEEDNEE